ncbi:hypothetical protein FVF75_12715 [Maritimibacter fusiformis]|uniref:Uncharacterized protein n=1 Tax=Maritimibacter fusiformis TaxID=2603819 RepID=A0A5D0RHU1_9RHOB|nr:hypothetical protein FVF75_12715 [Maritimibacter fusiformis]
MVVAGWVWPGAQVTRIVEFPTRTRAVLPSAGQVTVRVRTGAAGAAAGAIATGALTGVTGAAAGAATSGGGGVEARRVFVDGVSPQTTCLRSLVRRGTQFTVLPILART